MASPTNPGLLSKTTLHQSNERAITATTSSTPVDISDYVKGNLGVGEILFSATGAQTLVTTIESSDDVAFGSGVIVHATFNTYTQSDLKRTQHKSFAADTCHRYMRATFTVAGGTAAISACVFVSGMKQHS
jgi:hypothetical protein